MEKVRIISIDNPAEEIHYYNDYGIEISAEAYEEAMLRRTELLTRFECPICHNKTFGRFEPYEERGVTRWCSSCGHHEVDREKFANYMNTHNVPSIDVTSTAE